MLFWNISFGPFSPRIVNVTDLTMDFSGLDLFTLIDLRKSALDQFKSAEKAKNNADMTTALAKLKQFGELIKKAEAEKPIVTPTQPSVD